MSATLIILIIVIVVVVGFVVLTYNGLVQRREIPQPGETPRQDHQRQQVLISISPTPGPRHLLRRRSE